VNKSIVGAYAYSGQIFIHAQRFFVHSSLFNAFTKQFSERALALKRGRPEDASTEISEMIDIENAKRVEAWIKEAIA